MWSIRVPTFVHGRPEALAPFVRLGCADRLTGWHRDSGNLRPVLRVAGYGQGEEEGFKGGLRDVGDGTYEKIEDGEFIGCGCSDGGDFREQGRGEEGGFYQATEVL